MPYGIFPVPQRQTHPHDGYPNLAVKVRTRWMRRRLDEQLAHGADPASSDELELRAAQLRSRTGRSHLAGSLIKTLEDARGPEPSGLGLQPHRAEIRACADDLLALALRLRDERPVEVPGAALAALLMTRGASPLDPDSGASLGEAVRTALIALDPPSRRHVRVAA